MRAKDADAVPVIRAVREEDFPQIHALAQLTGGGMTNLPRDRDALYSRIAFALESFDAGASEPGGENYILVLDRGGEILGTAGIFSAIGLESGFVNYRINTMFHFSEQLGKRISRRMLVPTHDFTGASEVASLFLSPDARGGGFGKLLARSRYLFVAQAPHLFSDRMCAELRGWRDAEGGQPFWEAVGSHFFDMDFESADQHNSRAGNQFIADLMPIYPIYVAVLPETARSCIGKPHDSARPAYEMLLREGFEYTGYVDVFDGGPLVEAKVNAIKTVRDSVPCAVRVGEVPGTSPVMLLAVGTGKEFRCTRGPALMDPRTDGPAITMTRDCAAALQVDDGAPIRAIAW
ncbi:MAG: arginine N-succinyltransferase [Pseudomonadota bacterium]